MTASERKTILFTCQHGQASSNAVELFRKFLRRKKIPGEFKVESTYPYLSTGFDPQAIANAHAIVYLWPDLRELLERELAEHDKPLLIPYTAIEKKSIPWEEVLLEKIREAEKEKGGK